MWHFTGSAESSAIRNTSRMINFLQPSQCNPFNFIKVYDCYLFFFTVVGKAGTEVMLFTVPVLLLIFCGT